MYLRTAQIICGAMNDKKAMSGIRTSLLLLRFRRSWMLAPTLGLPVAELTFPVITR